jgi:maltooligosyltrehalose trehalohydrolase
MDRMDGRRFPVGAEVTSQGAHFRVWAPQCRSIKAVIEKQDGVLQCSLQSENNGYFSGHCREALAGDRYHFLLDDSAFRFPDPVSRFQPEGPHGPSQLVDPAFAWTDRDWKGVGHYGQVIYELHIGTFTHEGNWEAAAKKLPLLKDIGITAVEVMPVADFNGDFGWGYDGVNLFAPTRLYGHPDDFRKFIDRAHALELGVILDVVYNHFGPDGNYHHAFSRDYFTDRYETDWGEAINFDGENSGPVREFVTTNAAYWISEFHIDGLRLDATQNIYDTSKDNILEAITRSAREAAGERSVYIVAENELQIVDHVRPRDEGGYGMDSLWNDDLHHTAMVALTGHAEAYYTDYKGTPQEFVSCMKWGYLYQGQWYKWQQKKRGTSSRHVDPSCFVSFLENHDQVANSGKGQRVHQISNPGNFRAITALVVLLPSTAMLFQGQEFGSSRPFFYFASHRPDLARLVDEGRKKFLKQFPSLASDQMQQLIPDPASEQTFQRSKLDWTERERNTEMVDLHRDLITLRREDPVLSKRRPELDGAVLSHDAFLMRIFDADMKDRLLIVNLGHDLHLIPCPEPLLAEPDGHFWSVLWSSENPKYGGHGTPPLEKDKHWFLPGRAAVLLESRLLEEQVKERA